ncbi:MAG: PHP domain-containing protein [Promethearchaeota archaeon]|nr:MAG: PHP domain-containing protein [Candidatus Lokiarchaeota archaeon]
MLKIDLHTHSNFSDGHDSLDEILKIAIEFDVEKLAITDHMSAFGHFLFSNVKPAKSIERYLEEITRFRQKYGDNIEIYTGAEISSDFHSGKLTQQQEDRLQDNLEYFSLFLIETYVIQEPILTALNLRKYLTQQGFDATPVILAHPRYSSMSFETFRLLLNNHIGFELNEDKLSAREASFFLNHINSLTPQEKNKLTLSLGSDSHHKEEVGIVPFTSLVIEENNLSKYVITPPKAHDKFGV